MRRIVRADPGQASVAQEIGAATTAGSGTSSSPLPLPTPRDAAGAGAVRQTTRQPMQGVIKHEEFDARTRAKEILHVAEAEAARILNEAEHSRRDRLKEGYEAGYKQGYEAALSGLHRLEEQSRAEFAKVEPKIVQLAMKVAEKIIGTELKTRPEAIADIVTQALKAVRHQRSIKIRVHPAHVASIEQRRPGIMAVLSRAKEVEIVPDESVRQGGCVIESECGTIEAELTTQLEMIERALTGA